MLSTGRATYKMTSFVGSMLVGELAPYLKTAVLAMALPFMFASTFITSPMNSTTATTVRELYSTPYEGLSRDEPKMSTTVSAVPSELVSLSGRMSPVWRLRMLRLGSMNAKRAEYICIFTVVFGTAMVSTEFLVVPCYPTLERKEEKAKKQKTKQGREERYTLGMLTVVTILADSPIAT